MTNFGGLLLLGTFLIQCPPQGTDAPAARAWEKLVAQLKPNDPTARDKLLDFCKSHSEPDARKKAFDVFHRLPSLLDHLDRARLDPELLKAYDVPELVAVLFGHSRAIGSLAFSPDGKRIASSGWDNTVRLWNFGQAVPSEEAKVVGSPSVIAFSPNGRFLATGSPSTLVCLWDIAELPPKKAHALPGHRNRPFALAFDPTGKLFATGCFEPVLRLWKMNEGDPEAWAALGNEDTPAAKTISSLAFSSDGRLCAAGGMVGVCPLRVWDVSGNFLETRAVPEIAARLVAFDPLDHVLAFSSDDGAIHFLDLAAKAPKALESLRLAPPVARAHPFKSLAFSPTGEHLAVAEPSGKIDIWDMRSKKNRFSWSFPSEVRSVAFAREGRHLAVGGADGTILVLRLPKAGK